MDKKRLKLGYDNEGKEIWSDSHLVDDEGMLFRLVWEESELRYRLEFWCGDDDWDWDAQMEDYYNYKTKRFEGLHVKIHKDTTKQTA